MIKTIQFLTISALLITILFIAKPTFAYEESSGESYKCDLVIETPSAPGIIDKIFLDTTTSPLPTQEAFKLIAHLTDKSKSHMFESLKSPYKATIAYGYNTATSLPYEDELGEMRFVGSIPNTDEEDIDEDDTKECTKYRTIRGEEECVEYAEDQDPGDLINSWNTEGESFKFGSLGLASLRVYQFDGKTPANLNTRVCLKDISVVQSYQLTVSVAQPLQLGSKVIISGVVLDHAKPVKDAKVYLTIGSKTVSTSTDEDGEYSYDSDTTQTWGITQDQAIYNIQAKTTVDGKNLTASSNFGVNIPPPQSTGEKVEGVNPRVPLCRYFSDQNKDHWTTSSLQIPGPSSNEYATEPCQGEVFTEDDGEGPLTPLYDCLSNKDHFNSIYQPNCPSYKRVGYLYHPSSIPPSGTHPLYLCKTQDPNGVIIDQKTTLTSDCKNEPNETTIYTFDSLLGYLLEEQKKCVGEATTDRITVEGPNTLDMHQKYVETIGKATIYSSVIEQTESLPENNEPVKTGVSDSFINGVLKFGNIGCTFQYITGINFGFCVSPVELNKGTNKFTNLIKMFNGSYIPGIARDEPPLGNKEVLMDTEEGCGEGNKKIGETTQRIGNYGGNHYTSESADSITYPVDIENSQGSQNPPATIPLKGQLNPQAPLTVNEEVIPDDDRTKQYDCAQLLQFQGWYYNTSNGYRPPNFESLTCPLSTPLPNEQNQNR